MEGKCSSWNVTGREGEDLGTAVKQKDLCSPAQTVPVWLLSGESDTLIQCLSRPSDALLSFQRNKKMEAWAYTSSSTRQKTTKWSRQPAEAHTASMATSMSACMSAMEIHTVEKSLERITVVLVSYRERRFKRREWNYFKKARIGLY